MRAAVKGFEVKRLFLMEGDDFGKRSSMILIEHLTLSKTRKEKGMTIRNWTFEVKTNTVVANI